MRKRRINILLIINNKRSLFAENAISKSDNITKMNIFITFTFKTFNLKFIMKSRITIISLLKFNKSKFSE